MSDVDKLRAVLISILACDPRAVATDSAIKFITALINKIKNKQCSSEIQSNPVLQSPTKIQSDPVRQSPTQILQVNSSNLYKIAQL